MSNDYGLELEKRETQTVSVSVPVTLSVTVRFVVAVQLISLLKTLT